MRGQEAGPPVEPRLERITFFASASPETTALGWRVAGEPGFAPQHWATPGDVFDEVASPSPDRVDAVHLVVLELGPQSVVLTGEGGERVVAGSVLSGERRAVSPPG